MSLKGAAIQKSGDLKQPVELPRMLVDAFEGDKDLIFWVGRLRQSWLRWIVRLVMEPESEETKQRRCEDWAERLLMTMEAERELPMAIVRRLKGTRDAWAGWERMSVSRRRDFLLTYFGAKSLEARETQMRRLVEACLGKDGRR